MRAYVLCQLDYSSPVHISCNGWAIVDFKKVFQVYLGLITFVRLLHVYV